jgi:hypothetical protein
MRSRRFTADENRTNTTGDGTVKESEIEIMRQTAAFLVQAVADESRSMAFVEVKDALDERGLVVIIRGGERIDRVLPSLRNLCPEDVIRDGEPTIGGTN